MKTEINFGEDMSLNSLLLNSGGLYVSINLKSFIFKKKEDIERLSKFLGMCSLHLDILKSTIEEKEDE